MENKRPLRSVPDDELLRRLRDLARQSRLVEHDLLAHIAEVDARKLYAREACSSMFAYCARVLGLTGAEAYMRITAARASRRHPVLLTMLEDGRLSLTAASLLAPHLTLENRDGLLARAAHRSKRQVLELIAEIAPRPDAPSRIRKLPERRPVTTTVCPGSVAARPAAPEFPLPQMLPGATPPTSVHAVELCPDRVSLTPTVTDAVEAMASVPAPTLHPDVVKRPAIVLPLSPGRYRVQFTASAELRDKLQRLQDLMRSTIPDCDLAALIEIAVTEKIDRLEAKRFGRTKTPRKTLATTDLTSQSRYIPVAVKRMVSERDGYQCRFTDRLGRRCPERARIDRGRDAGFPAPPAQIRACAASALGSCLR